ncbi:hypothetical protein KAT92_04980 [Candidatus Babeliales bacterium]|nr:hypothetical protein [Candidatus Babeliales bacterium]
MSNKRKIIISIILFGSIWGGLEAVVTSSMEAINTVIPRSVVLALVALIVLSYARYSLPRKGTTLLIGLVAAGFKFLGIPTLFGCQLAGVIGQAVILELTFSIAEERGWFSTPLKMLAVVGVSSYLNSLTFCFSQAYIFQNHWWYDRGVSGLLEWSFVAGSLAMIASVIGFGLSTLLVKISLAKYERLIELRQTAFIGTAITVSAICWLIGAFLMNEQLVCYLY